MRSLAMCGCFQKQTGIIDDEVGVKNEVYQGNERDNGGTSASTAMEPYLVSGNTDSSSMSEQPRRSGCLEIFLSFYYYFGVSPFRIDRKRNLRSSCLNKLLNIFVTLMALMYGVFNVRRLVWEMDKPDISQQEKATSYIALVYQFCSFLLHACVFRMVWCKQEAFQKLFRFQDISEISSILKPSLERLMVALTCSMTVLLPIISTVGGLTLMDRMQPWSISEILSYHETQIFLGLKKSWDYADSNNTTGVDTNATDDDDYVGIFLNDGNLETILFGSIGMAVDFCQQVFSLFSHDCFLLSTISLWIYTKELRNQLKTWKNRVQERTEDCEIGSRNFAVDIVKEYNELSLFSNKINAITNSFLPALIMGSIITMSYFMYNIVTRQWFFAMNLSLKLWKIWIAIYFAIKTSIVAEEYYIWFISEDVQEILGLSKQLPRIFAEMKERPLGNGSSVFYIDTRFLLSILGITSTYFYMVTGTGT